MSVYVNEPVTVEARPIWRSIFLGLLVGLSVQILLSLLGIAIGLSALDVTGENQNAGGVGVGAALWTLVSTIIAWFLGAHAAAYSAGVSRRSTGLLHGIAVWCLGLLAVMFLVGSGISNIVSGAFGAVTQGAQTAGETGAVSRPDMQRYRAQAREKMQNLTPEDAQKAKEGAAKGAWGAFLGAVLSFGAACLGGVAGARALEAGFDRRRLEHDRQTREPPRGPIVTTPT